MALFVSQLFGGRASEQCQGDVFSTTVNVTGCFPMSQAFGMINRLQQLEMKHGQ